MSTMIITIMIYDEGNDDSDYDYSDDDDNDRY